MAKYFKRKDIIKKLNEEITGCKPIFLFGAGIGLTAKCAELGGADLIGVYSTAFYRMHGVSSLIAWLPYSNANDELLNSAKYILPVIKKTPCIAGIGAHDPTRDIDNFINEVIALGFSGITNEPFVGIYGEFAKLLEDAGIGFSKEVELIRKANEKDIFTVAWVFNENEAIEMTKAGADIIGAMIGLTSGGLVGAKATLSLEDSTEIVKSICGSVKKINKDTMVITHGGPFNDPKTAEYSINNSTAVGYASGSSGERVPTEQSVIEIVKKYKMINMKQKY